METTSSHVLICIVDLKEAMALSQKYVMNMLTTYRMSEFYLKKGNEL